MKAVFKSVVIASLILSGAASAAVSSLVSKEVDKAGGFAYTYKYFCSRGNQGTFTLGAKTDEEAKKLAEVKAKRVCEE